MLMNNKCNVVFQWVCSYHRQNESTAVSDLGRKIQLSIQNRIGKDSEDTVIAPTSVSKLKMTSGNG